VIADEFGWAKTYDANYLSLARLLDVGSSRLMRGLTFGSGAAILAAREATSRSSKFVALAGAGDDAALPAFVWVEHDRDRRVGGPRGCGGLRAAAS